MSQIWPFVLGALGIFTIIAGVRIILTGKMSAREEEKLVMLAVYFIMRNNCKKM